MTATASGIAATAPNCGEASINDVPIAESERRYLGARSASEYGQEIPLW
ncbi:histidine kinase [Mycobacterium tuberculosis TRS1]|uniref:Response regulator receiver domain-containing protein n=2 Tax=Mycobacterium tuberculosis complex TaxID=77643 RepID=A0A066S1K5_MYCTX|nr:response regulator receiver domain-containing protein [Mycobacterium tuberculosis KZN 1435]AFE11518.1 response regulator receiver domain-containing protein [Mycobacterium tuberculosis RGTB423]AFE15152.1 response regulator receiver domain-containing protein [Mycobacterium tuberculosis RGTB327]AGE66082.1 hypothetical protein K60_001720 [Mycobacterium tuberculosis variant bovis BCG str. Korea 1168P]AGL98600.1 response regulator receiver domain-containing protein [Mycobacterium tuberculosis CCDC